MKIIHLLKHCERGNGHVHVAVDLACEQSRRGENVCFISGGGSYVDLLKRHGVQHIALKQNVIHSPLSIIRLISIFLSIKPNVVHAHMMSSAVLGFLVSKITRVRLLTTVHNSFDRHSSLMRLGDLVVAVSWSEYNMLLGRGYNRKKLRMVHNGPIGSAREDEDLHDLGVDIPSPCLMTLSGLHKRKRVDFALKVFASISADYPAWKFTVVGGGPDLEYLRKICGELKIEDKVYFAGPTTHSIDRLKKASIFLCLSEAEPFGLAVAEARAAGCAIIVSNVGGMPEIVEQGAAGFVVPLDDMEAVTAVLKNLISSEEHLKRWRLAALNGAEKFSVDRMADAYRAIYQELCGV